MNDCIHAARYVRKRDSQLMGSFTSSPAGILGQLRGDKSIYYYTKLPADKKFYNLKTVAIKSKSIFIWTVMFDCALKLPEEFLQGLDALILKGMGSGIFIIKIYLIK